MGSSSPAEEAPHAETDAYPTAFLAAESPRGELAFAARLAENVSLGDASQPAARPGSVPLADGGSHPAQAPLSRPELHSTHDPAAGALTRRAGQFDPSETGAVTSANGVHEASDEPRHAALKSATASDDSGSGRTKTDLAAGERFRVEAGAREAASTALEPSGGKPAGASPIAALEPARAATLDRNPDRGGAPQASSAQASIAAAAAEKSAAMVRNAEPARNISVRLATDQMTNVEVRLIDRGGEVRVAVRSTDPQLAETMRAGLSGLSERLSEHGFKTEIWRPESAGTFAGFSSRPGSESSGQQDSRQHGGSGQHAGRNPSQQQQPGQQHQQRRPQWVEELEHTPSPTSPLKRSKKA